MARSTRCLLAIVGLTLLGLAALGCGGGGASTRSQSNALTNEEEAFLLETKKVKNQVVDRWNDVVGIARKNDWNVVNISDAEHKVIQRKLDAVADIANDAVMDSPTQRFNKLMHLWDTYRGEVIDLDNAMGDLLSDPTDATRKAYKRAVVQEKKVREAFDKEARRLIAASLEPAQ
jgi:hypothetical protein